MPDFFSNPILNSPYAYPQRHWETDADNRPTGAIKEMRRPSSLCSPIPVVRWGQGLMATISSPINGMALPISKMS